MLIYTTQLNCLNVIRKTFVILSLFLPLKKEQLQIYVEINSGSSRWSIDHMTDLGALYFVPKHVRENHLCSQSNKTRAKDHVIQKNSTTWENKSFSLDLVKTTRYTRFLHRTSCGARIQNFFQIPRVTKG